MQSLTRFSTFFGRCNTLSRGRWIKVTAWRSNKSNYLRVFAMSTGASMVDQEIFFSQPTFNRAAECRADSNWLSKVFSTSGALVVPVLGSKSLVKCGEPVMVSSTKFKMDKVMGGESLCNPIFLGLTNAENEPVFAVEVSDICSEDGDTPAWLEGTEWVDLRRYGSQLRISDAGLLAYARGMVEWHARNRFCGHCGGKMEVRDGGHCLQCASKSCESSAYPRLDPAVIMLVTCGDYILLGRQSKWDPGRYSLLAGFVEIGETFEMAVVREVKEEAGIKVNACSIRYAASQPWPFPSSLMVGFTAEAERNPILKDWEPIPTDQIVPVGNKSLREVAERNCLPKPEVDSKELEDARWIHKSFLREVLLGMQLHHNVCFNVPGKYAIAHVLMERWITDNTDTDWAGNHLRTAEIDEGIFKYVLIRVLDGCGNEKLIVRGDRGTAYHADIFNKTREQLKIMGLQAEVLGGGRIEHLLEQGIIHVYGFSQAYGQANHAVTVTILQQWFPFHDISCSWDGY